MNNIPNNAARYQSKPETHGYSERINLSPIHCVEQTPPVLPLGEYAEYAHAQLWRNSLQRRSPHHRPGKRQELQRWHHWIHRRQVSLYALEDNRRIKHGG